MSDILCNGQIIELFPPSRDSESIIIIYVVEEQELKEEEMDIFLNLGFTVLKSVSSSKRDFSLLYFSMGKDGFKKFVISSALEEYKVSTPELLEAAQYLDDIDDLLIKAYELNKQYDYDKDNV